MKKTILSFVMVSSLFTNFSSIHAQSIPNYVPQNGLVGFWPFDNNANDVTGNNHHGTELNVIPTMDRFGNDNAAYEFDGKSSRIEINDNFFDISWQSYSISLWLNSYSYNNSNNYNDSQCLLNTDKHNGIGIALHGDKNPFSNTYNDKYSLGIGSNPNVRYWDLIGNYSAESNNLFTINQWNHYVLVKQDVNTFLVYINGQLDKRYTTVYNANTFLTKLVFGATAKDILPAEVFLGKLDEYGIWDRALDPTEIQSLYNGNTASVKENVTQNEMIIYPNPTNDLITIKQLGNSNYHYQLHDLNGKIVHQNELTDESISLKSVVDAGIYFISILNDKEEIIKKSKIILN